MEVTISNLNLARVRKLLVAGVGLGLLVASSVFGSDLTGASDEVISIFDGVVALLVALGVYRVPNAPEEVPYSKGLAPGFEPDGKHRI